MTFRPHSANGFRRPLSAWELPLLLRPLGDRRPVNSVTAKPRSHFDQILAFVYANRFATAAQIRRRLPAALRSDRTTRRHLAEMQSLRWLDTVETLNTSPLWPKVYFVTGEGRRQIERSLARTGCQFDASDRDRKRTEGANAAHVFHELSITEFMLSLWEAVESRDDLELPIQRRRGMGEEAYFQVSVRGNATRVIPDALFLFRRKPKGMMCCFVEVDCGTCRRSQIESKLHRYQNWSESNRGMQFLTNIYRQSGAENPKPVFRILFVVSGMCAEQSRKRIGTVCDWAGSFPEWLKERLWFISSQELVAVMSASGDFSSAVWRRIGKNGATLF